MTNRQLKQKAWELARNAMRNYPKYGPIPKQEIKRAMTDGGINPKRAGYYINYFVSGQIFQKANGSDSDSLMPNRKIFDLIQDGKNPSYGEAVAHAAAYRSYKSVSNVDFLK